MKYPKCLLIACILFTFNFTGMAQDALNSWAIGLGVNTVNNPTSRLKDPVRGIPLEPGRYSTWNISPTGLRFNATRYINRGFAAEAVLSANTITENNPDSEAEFPYLSVEGMIKYNFRKNNLRINSINPYVGIGGGYTWLDKIGAGNLNGTVGVNFWVSEAIGFNVQSTIKHPFKDYGIDHFQYSVGAIYRFVKKDSDGDGVPNNIDECPGTRGPKALNGCPDSDRDGIKNADDECPRQAGPIEFNGCPDTDGDGIPDKKDQCPEVYGYANNDGCPNPDTDQDGVKDFEDNCPNEAGSISNKGCPEVVITKEDEIKINDFARTLLFNYGKETIQNASLIVLDEIVSIMRTYPKSEFYIDGHTDNTSGASYNLRLSRKRANAVKQYLIQQGIESSRLRARGFGEGRPITTNKTKEGRLMNRRVEIILRN